MAFTISHARHEVSGEFRGWHIRSILDILPVGAYTCDPDGLITYYNRHAERLWGRAPRLNDPVERFCGSFRLYLPDGSPVDHENCWMGQALQQNKEFDGPEIVIERPDGQRVTVMAYASPIHSETGEVLGGINILVDISDRKQAVELLAESTSQRNRLVAGPVDELRNSLAPIRNAIQILHLQKDVNVELRWALDIMDRQIRQVAKAIENLEQAVAEQV